MWLPVLITVLIYSLIITIVDLIKDTSSYSMGLDGWIDIVVAGPVMWVVLVVLMVVKVSRPLYNKFHKEKPRRVKHYSNREIQRTVTWIIKLYKKEYSDYVIWVSPQNVDLYINEVDKPSDIRVRKIRYEWLEKKYYKMCKNQPDEVWSVICKIGHPVTESRDWKEFKEYAHKSCWEKVEKAGCIEL